MSTYHYTPLNIGEIRLIELHLGRLDDQIDISIRTIHFAVPQNSPLQVDSDQIDITLPKGWSVQQNLEGRLLYWNEWEHRTTWDHPILLDGRSANPNEDEAAEMVVVPFEALSYTWGSVDDPRRIRVANGEGIQIQELEVTQNLYDALRHLRNESGLRILWIDAISISQNDLLERSQQVTRMRDIYTYAQRVVV
jgi:hypothetical protein